MKSISSRGDEDDRAKLKIQIEQFKCKTYIAASGDSLFGESRK